MNCQSFENVVNDLAREQVMDARVREVALRHSAVCGHCAERLDDQRELTGKLQQAAAQVRASHASPAIESALLAEFRRHSASQRVTPQVASVSGRNRYALHANAIAAILLIVFGVVVVRFRNNEGVPTEMSNVEVSNAGRLPGEDTGIVVAPIMSSISGFASDAKVMRSSKPKNLRRVAKSKVTVEITKLVAVNNPEISSEFIPIGYSTASNVQEGGQLFRVELSRSTMAQFGFPVNMERYDERVKADVWVGVDGLARAIRFVQEPSQ